MGLRGFEDRLERLVEGSLTMPFRGPIQPIEISHRMLREMDLGRRVGVRGLIAPTHSANSISPADLDRPARPPTNAASPAAAAAADGLRRGGQTAVGPPCVWIRAGPGWPIRSALPPIRSASSLCGTSVCCLERASSAGNSRCSTRGCRPGNATRRTPPAHAEHHVGQYGLPALYVTRTYARLHQLRARPPAGHTRDGRAAGPGLWRAGLWSDETATEQAPGPPRCSSS